ASRSAGTSQSSGSTTARTAGRPRSSRARSNNGARRRSTGTPSRTSTSYGARPPIGPVGYVETGSHRGVVVRRSPIPATRAYATATARSRTRPISVRYDMAHDAPCRDPEIAVALLVARRHAEDMLVQAGDKTGQRAALLDRQSRLADVFGWRL